MAYSRFTQLSFTALLLSACVSQPTALQHIAVLDDRHVQHFASLDALGNLANGANSPQGFIGKDETINTFALKATHPSIILADDSFRAEQTALESIAPIIWLPQGTDILMQLQQEFLDIGALVGKERLAKKQWRALMRHIKGTRKQLAKYKAPLLLFYEEGEFYAYGASEGTALLTQIFEVDFIDRHLASEKKRINASYLQHLQPDLVFILSEDASQNALPSDPFSPSTQNSPTVIALNLAQWQNVELTLKSLYTLSEKLRIKIPQA